MKQITNRIVSVVLVLMLLISFMPTLTLQANAATVNYVYSGNYIYNWGTRGTTATFLSPNAEAFYEDNDISYSDLSALSGSSSTSSVPSSSLYSALKNLMSKNHTHITSYSETKNLYQYTDCQGSGLTSKKISSFYSGLSIGPSWDGGWNREHTWPNSKGMDGNDENDIMMLRPTSTSENSSRGNKAYGESGSYYDPNDESGGKYNLHGDVARIMLYVYVRWGNTSKMWGTSGVMESKEVLLKWMEEDPVDTWELGRNDSVEAITGTRNVFVDYPELAFILFDEDIPTNMQTPSGEASNTSQYTISVVSSNAAYGTVTLAGNTITAIPAAGYYASGYTVVSGSASVTRSGDVFKVKADSNCTIRINFEKQETITVRYLENGQHVSSYTAVKGGSITLPQLSGNAPEGYVFRGWVTSAVNDTTVRPTYYTPGSKLTVTGDTDLYALYSFLGELSGEPSYTWTQITSTSELIPGSQLVMACPEKGTVAGSLSSAYLTSVEATFSADLKTIPNLPSNALVLTLGGSQNAWTLSGSNGLLGATAAKNVAFGSGTTTWSISFSNGAATIQNSVSSCGRFLYNYTAPRFNTYTSGTTNTMLLPHLYMRKADSGTTYYTTGESFVEDIMPTGTVRMANLSLELESVIFMNFKCVVEGFEGYDLAENMGLLMWTGEGEYSEELFVVGNENVTDMRGATMDAEGRWVVQTPGIAAKEMGNEYYIRAYVALPDGTYIYSTKEGATQIQHHGVQKYALGQLTGTDENMKKVVVALMDYAAAAQVQFNYKLDDLANDIDYTELTTELGFTDTKANIILTALEAYKTEYSAEMIIPTATPDSAIVGSWIRDDAAKANVGVGATLTLEGIITNNYKFTLKTVGKEPVSGKVLFWEQETYKTLLKIGEAFSESNATYVYDMEQDETGRYIGVYDKTAAKDMGNTLYVCALITTTDGEVLNSGVITHSAHAYLKGQINGATTAASMVSLSKALVVYGDTAAYYFANR